MTLEATTHCEDKAKELRKQADCIECANEHEQLVDWLEELKLYKKAFELACKAIYEETVTDYCEPGDDNDDDWTVPCRKGNFPSLGLLDNNKCWDNNKCVECCMEHFLKQARKRGSENETD